MKLIVIFISLLHISKTYASCNAILNSDTIPLSSWMHDILISSADSNNFKLTLNCTNVKDEHEMKAIEYKLYEGIIIADSNYTQLNPNLYNSFINLKKLYLTNDNISFIESYSFAGNGLAFLQELYLDKNNLSKIIPDTFYGLKNLILLSLSYNKLSALENIDILTELEELRVTNNELTVINENSFKNMYKLKFLNLHNNHLSTLGEIDEIHTLNVLNLSMNHFEVVTKYDFHKLNSLKIIDLSDNSLQQLQSELFIYSPNLQRVYLRNNEIEIMTNNIFKNSIPHIDLSLNFLHSLQCEQFNGSIVLHDNYFETICNFSNETFNINLSNNNVEEIKNGAFKIYTKLEILNLSYNLITKLELDTFQGLKKLNSLFLNGNMISSIPVGTFRHLENLSTLNLSHNEIESINHGEFTNLQQLISLDLSKNRIQNINLHVFYPLKNVKSLYLHGNPLQMFYFNDLKAHLPKLKYISFHYPKIECEQLSYDIKHLSIIYGVEVQHGDEITKHNIHGIECNPHKKKGNLLDYIFVTFRSIRTSFILIVTIFSILIVIQCLSYRKYITNCTNKSVKNNGINSSLVILTDEQE